MKKAINDKFKWQKHAIKVDCGEKLEMHWEYTMAHKTHGYSFEITNKPVDFKTRLTRDDLQTFQQDLNSEEPFWSHSLPAKSDISVVIPHRDPGFHVLMARWIVADTGQAFHQSWVLDVQPMGDSGHTAEHHDHL